MLENEIVVFFAPNRTFRKAGLSMVFTANLGSGIFLIDSNFLDMKGFCSSYVLHLEDESVLIEPGPSVSSPTLLEGIRALGCDLNSFKHIILTHIHFDHAGGAGDMADRMPNATVVVHERGAKHIIDPSRLVESARRVFGESLSRYGDFKAVEKNRVRPVNDGAEIRFRSGRLLKIFDAPGHASHEICVLDEETGGLFTGDAAGLYFKDTNETVPTTPPPDFDLDLSVQTIDRLIGLKPKRLFFSHFGAVDQAYEVLSESKNKLTAWGERILETFARSSSNEKVKMEELSSILEIRTKALQSSFKQEHRRNCIEGYLRFYRKKGILPK